MEETGKDMVEVTSVSCAKEGRGGRYSNGEGVVRSSKDEMDKELVEKVSSVSLPTSPVVVDIALSVLSVVEGTVKESCKGATVASGRK